MKIENKHKVTWLNVKSILVIVCPVHSTIVHTLHTNRTENRGYFDISDCLSNCRALIIGKPLFRIIELTKTSGKYLS